MVKRMHACWWFGGRQVDVIKALMKGASMLWQQGCLHVLTSWVSAQNDGVLGRGWDGDCGDGAWKHTVRSVEHALLDVGAGPRGRGEHTHTSCSSRSRLWCMSHLLAHLLGDSIWRALHILTKTGQYTNSIFTMTMPSVVLMGTCINSVWFVTVCARDSLSPSKGSACNADGEDGEMGWAARPLREREADAADGGDVGDNEAEVAETAAPLGDMPNHVAPACPPRAKSAADERSQGVRITFTIMWSDREANFDLTRQTPQQDLSDLRVWGKKQRQNFQWKNRRSSQAQASCHTNIHFLAAKPSWYLLLSAHSNWRVASETRFLHLSEIKSAAICTNKSKHGNKRSGDERWLWRECARKHENKSRLREMPRIKQRHTKTIRTSSYFQRQRQ